MFNKYIWFLYISSMDSLFDNKFIISPCLFFFSSFNSANFFFDSSIFIILFFIRSFIFFISSIALNFLSCNILYSLKISFSSSSLYKISSSSNKSLWSFFFWSFKEVFVSAFAFKDEFIFNLFFINSFEGACCVLFKVEICCCSWSTSNLELDIISLFCDTGIELCIFCDSIVVILWINNY